MKDKELEDIAWRLVAEAKAAGKPDPPTQADWLYNAVRRR